MMDSLFWVLLGLVAAAGFAAGWLTARYQDSSDEGNLL